MADQVLLMRQGQIEQDGPPSALYERPASVFTARFVGTPPMNVLPATALGAMWPTLAPLAPAHPPGELLVGVRAEAARLAPLGVAAQVVGSEYLGADTLIDARIGGVAFMLRLPGRSPLPPGSNATIAWDAGATHWFAAATGRRID